MAFDWSIFAEEVGKVSERAQAGILQRGAEKRGEERQLRMAREMQDISLEGRQEQLEIEEPYKELSDERILARQKEIARASIELQKGYSEHMEKFRRGLDMFSGSEGYRKSIEKARKEGGLSQVAIMKMEDSLMRVKAGEMVDISDFEGLDPFDRMHIMDLLKQNQITTTQVNQAQQRLSNEALRLQEMLAYRKSITESREGVGVKRGLDVITKLDTSVEKAEKEFSDYRSELMNAVNEEALDSKGRLKGMKGKNLPLVNPETGEFDPKILTMLLEKKPKFKFKFQRLFQLQGDVMKHQMIKEQYLSEGEAGESNTWTGSDGKTYEVGKVYTIGGQKVKCTGENQFEPVE